MSARFGLQLFGFLAVLGPSLALAVESVSGPAYHIVLRSRHAVASPEECKKAQTGGGSIIVEQPEANTIVVTMQGSAAAGSGLLGSGAGICFEMVQDLDIVPTRNGLRPPRVGMIGRVVGTLQVTKPGHFSHAYGNAGQGPATACLLMNETPVLSVDVEPTGVWCGQKLSINHQTGPVESPTVAGNFRLATSFRLGAQQGKGILNHHYAIADFDPAPQFDAHWADGLKPFRAVPRQEFGFQLVLRVVEEPPVDPNSGNPGVLAGTRN